MKVIDKTLSAPPNVGLQSTIARAYLIMKEFEHRNLAVVSGAELIGVISREDIKRAIAMQARTGVQPLMPKAELLVRNFMSSPVKEVSGKQGLSVLLRTFLDEGIAAVVLCENEKHVAILTREDVLKIFDHLTRNGEIDLDDALKRSGLGVDVNDLARYLDAKVH